MIKKSMNALMVFVKIAEVALINFEITNVCAMKVSVCFFKMLMF